MDLELLRSIVASWAASHLAIRAVWLIGSRARGDAEANSDVDLAIACRLPPEYADGHWQRLDWQQELQALIPYPVHLLHCRPDKKHVWSGAKKGRVWVYWRSPGRILGVGPDEGGI
ncbi:nucleotidyltransferase family protein [Muricoccus nepalensis]|uniref:nucleotidyltransferase family protein n=1 Tax=Muricoccus nepalensis TaxID=1854500 RepID=UPI001386693A|nr:nucleotidyltransferase domain-containing protein [Roseomonas nepalensis]